MFEFGRHKITTIGIEPADIALVSSMRSAAVALAHIGIERALVFARRSVCETRPTVLQNRPRDLSASASIRFICASSAPLMRSTFSSSSTSARRPMDASRSSFETLNPRTSP
jgi:hypothetical protein